MKQFYAASWRTFSMCPFLYSCPVLRYKVPDWGFDSRVRWSAAVRGLDHLLRAPRLISGSLSAVLETITLWRRAAVSRGTRRRAPGDELQRTAGRRVSGSGVRVVGVWMWSRCPPLQGSWRLRERSPDIGRARAPHLVSDGASWNWHAQLQQQVEEEYPRINTHTHTHTQMREVWLDALHGKFVDWTPCIWLSFGTQTKMWLSMSSFTFIECKRVRWTFWTSTGIFCHGFIRLTSFIELNIWFNKTKSMWCNVICYTQSKAVKNIIVIVYNHHPSRFMSFY